MMTLPANLPAAFQRAFDKYALDLREIAKSLIAKAQPEDQLKTPVQSLLRAAVLGIETRSEVAADEGEGRPDIGVAVCRLLCGYVELKAPGFGANTSRFKDHNKRQWEKFRALPNILYTDGLEWALYRSGERVGSPVCLADDAGALVKTSPTKLAELHSLLLDFFTWTPLVPKSAQALAAMLAPLCRLLREDVLLKLQDPNSNLTLLNANVRDSLFPDATNEQFADIYAQTLTYSLLLARLNGEKNLTTESAARDLQSGHSLLASVLSHMANRDARAEVETPVSILERVIAAVEPALLCKDDRDPWLYFYEDFLAAYDRKLRSNRGVYYTPVQVIGAQVRLVAELLDKRFGKPLAFADENVFLLDPAAGTCAYPLAAIAHALHLVEARQGRGALAGKATQLAGNVHAFEILVGPYAVGHLRLSQMILAAGGALPADGIHVYLTDTLESPHADTPPQSLFSKPLTDEHRRAANVKKHVPIMVCMGNPPYDRESHDPAELDANPDLQRKGGWVRHGDTDKEGESSRPILRDFIEPAQRSGGGKHIKNLYNDYVYFWRWALWKMFENPDACGPGVLSFITASSYLRGPGFTGMRRKMREAFDELWIIDLEGDQLGARKTENVFAIQTPVAIAIGIRTAKNRPNKPAIVRYTRLTGTQAEKFAALEKIGSFKDLPWEICFQDWEEPFLPENKGSFFKWPLLTDIHPWQHSGVQFKRTWPIAANSAVLAARWSSLLNAQSGERRTLFRETPSRSIASSYEDFINTKRLAAILSLKPNAEPIEPTRYAFRSLDRQWVLPDGRLCDRPRAPLWHSLENDQVFITSLLTGILGYGPAAVACANVPDLHHFRGSFGGKDIIPLYRDAAAQEPNVTHGVIEVLAGALGATEMPEDLFAYCYAVLSAPGYVATFSEELTIPGPRIPITKEPKRFRKAVELGRKLIWLHTYGERMRPDGASAGVPQGAARCRKAIPGTAAAYPEEFSYEETPQLLRVGLGEFAPVSKAVFTFSVSGLEVVNSWLRYRMKGGAGRTSSPLDEIRPEVWTAQMTQELLELLWVLEATVALQPELDKLLAEICAGPVFTAAELPQPTDPERRPPAGDDGEGGDKHAEFEGLVAEVEGREYVPPAAEPKRKASRAKKSPAPQPGALSAFCATCHKVTTQTPVGYPETKRRVVRQTLRCSKCGEENRMETKAVRKLDV